MEAKIIECVSGAVKAKRKSKERKARNEKAWNEVPEMKNLKVDKKICGVYKNVNTTYFIKF